MYATEVQQFPLVPFVSARRFHLVDGKEPAQKSVRALARVFNGKAEIMRAQIDVSFLTLDELGDKELDDGSDESD